MKKKLHKFETFNESNANQNTALCNNMLREIEEAANENGLEVSSENGSILYDHGSHCSVKLQINKDFFLIANHGDHGDAWEYMILSDKKSNGRSSAHEYFRTQDINKAFAKLKNLKVWITFDSANEADECMGKAKGNVGKTDTKDWFFNFVSILLSMERDHNPHSYISQLRPETQELIVNVAEELINRE